ncbi:MAG: SH3-like domain-containing protein, partial [bacterium]
GQHLYSVRFEARALWGDADAPRGEDCAAVYIDLFEPYLRAADDHA